MIEHKKTEHNIRDIINIFDACFAKYFNTRLVKGASEPLYRPANNGCDYHSVVFANGFFSSALHESAHWLIAGSERRKKIDYGYWYAPDGRNSEQQLLFEKVEVKPQALEWILSQAAAYPFQVSLDNLVGESTSALGFKKAVYQQVLDFIELGLSPRAELLRNHICSFYGVSTQLNADRFKLLSSEK